MIYNDDTQCTIIRTCTRCREPFTASRLCQKQCQFCEATDITKQTYLDDVIANRWGEELVTYQAPGAKLRKAKD